MTKRTWTYIAGGVILLLLVIQLLPTEAPGNPPVETELATADPVTSVLRRSCYDCHSFRTEWPWYSHVAPMKWLVRDHVAEGRDNLNFTAWNRLSPEDRPHKLEEIAEEVEEGHMPLRSYLVIHRDARLTDAERQLLVDWATAAAAEAHPAAPVNGEPGAEPRDKETES